MTQDLPHTGEPKDLEFEKFILHRVIAPSGDAGVVFSARERVRTTTSRRMAVTILDPDSTDPSGLESLMEAWAAATSVSHPVLHRLAGYGEHAGLHYYVTPWLDGWSLWDISRALRDSGEAPDVATVASLGIHLAEALATLHELDSGPGSPNALVHGRVSPSRVMVMPSGQVKLLGFGVPPRWSARYAPRPTSTRHQAFLAPEQVRGDVPDPRTDVYALSLLLHAFHSGSNPQERDDLEDTNQAILEGLQAEIAPELAAALLPGLALDPDQRPSSMRWLADQLQRTAVEQGGLFQPSDWRVLLQDLFADEDGRPVPEVSPDERERFESVISEVRAVADPAMIDQEDTEAVETGPPRSLVTASPRRRPGLAVWALLILAGVVLLLLALNGGLLALERLDGDAVPAPAAVVEEGPDAVEVYLDEAQRFLAAEDVAPAKALLEAAREAGTADPDLDARMAGLDEALERADHLVSARAHLELGEHEEAMLRLIPVLDANPDDPEAFALFQVCKAALASKDEAVDEADPPRASSPARSHSSSPATSPAPEPTGPGKATIRSQPQSMVYIDGEFVGTTPLVDIVLDAGQHTVEFKLGGRNKVTRTVQVRAGATTRVDATLPLE